MTSVVLLREQLRHKFPKAHRDQKERSYQKLGPYSFPLGALTEVVAPPPQSCASLLLAHLLDASATGKTLPLALIDGADSFDPASYPPQNLPHLLWIRCQDAATVLRTADLLLHDGNLPFVVADLSLNPRQQLTRTPASSWYRLRALSESSGTSLLAFTPFPTVPNPVCRLSPTHDFDLSELLRVDLTDPARPPDSLPASRHYSS